MPDPAVAALATDPNAKVLVFIDGQNLYKTCASLFQHPLCHPHLLAEVLAGPRTKFSCRFYTGRPNPNVDPTGARNLDRRLNVMRQHGVTFALAPRSAPSRETTLMIIEDDKKAADEIALELRCRGQDVMVYELRPQIIGGFRPPHG